MKEPFYYLKYGGVGKEKVLVKFDHLVDYFFVLLIVFFPISIILGFNLPYGLLLTTGFLVWTILASIRLLAHVKHWKHWLGILLVTVFLGIVLHEIPNTVAMEWKYNNAPFLNLNLYGVPLWVFVGWYVMILVMLRLWVRFTWRRHGQ